MARTITTDTDQRVRTDRREIRQGRRADGFDRRTDRRNARGNRVRAAQRLEAQAARAGVVTL